MVAAALALPGVAASQGESGPDPAVVGLRWLDYSDRQPGFERIRVRSPSVLLRSPVGAEWSLEAQGTRDAVSGASPRWHSSVSGASRVSEDRRAGEVRVTRHERSRDWTLGVATSDENDFRSRAVSMGARVVSDDRNREWNAAVALTRDHISSRDDPALDARRRTVEATVGFTQALSRADVVQFGLTLAEGRGYFSDPYKRVDERPASRHQVVGVARWNHHFESAGVTLRAHYRGYRDSFGVRSHTLALEPVVALGERWSLTPTLRLYTQSAARFYYDPSYSYAGAPWPPGYFDTPQRYLSADARLSAFGAVTAGAKVAVRIDEQWSADLRVDRYEQRGEWRLGGAGSPGLAPLIARIVQVGVLRRF